RHLCEPQPVAVDIGRSGEDDRVQHDDVGDRDEGDKAAAHLGADCRPARGDLEEAVEKIHPSTLRRARGLRGAGATEERTLRNGLGMVLSTDAHRPSPGPSTPDVEPSVTLNTVALELVPPNVERGAEQALEEAHKVLRLSA